MVIKYVFNIQITHVTYYEFWRRERRRKNASQLFFSWKITAIINTNHEIGTSTMNDVFGFALLCFPSLISFVHNVLIFIWFYHKKIVSKFYHSSLSCFVSGWICLQSEKCWNQIKYGTTNNILLIEIKIGAML